jgi:adenylate cyclase
LGETEPSRRAEPARREEAIERVRRFLSDLGVPDREIDEATREDVLDLLVVDRLLVPEGTMTATEVAERTGLEVSDLDRLWRALGFANVGDDEKVFSELDLGALAQVRTLLDLGMTDVGAMLRLARVIGSSMARIAEAELASSPVLRGDLDSTEMAELFAATAEMSMSSIVSLMEYVWRRHLQAAGRRAMLLRGRGERGPVPTEMAVGFADLVGFTVLSQELPDDELSEVVARFETLAYDTVSARHGRVVKMIGDEAMFVVHEVDQAVRISLALSEAYADDELLSDVRVGTACGPVLAREGDYYGPVVNLASRIVNLARPGTVLVSDDVHRALAEDLSLAWKQLRPRTLKDIGRVQLWAVEHKNGRLRSRDRRTWTSGRSARVEGAPTGRRRSAT